MTAEERLAATITIPLTHRSFEAGGRKLHCVIAGSGPPLVLVHGLNIGWGQWHAVIPKLAERYTVYAIDLPGAGEADKIDYLSVDVARMTLDSVEEALRALTPDGATVVGHSIGAWAVLKLASRGSKAIRSVVVVDPVGFTEYVPPGFRPLALRFMARFLAATVMRPNSANLRKFFEGVMVDPSTLTDAFVDYVTEHVSRPPITHPFLLIHRLFRPFRFRPEFLFTSEELAAIRVPVTVIHGGQDPLIPLAKVRNEFSRIPDARVIVMDGVGHVPPIERPAEFTRNI